MKKNYIQVRALMVKQNDHIPLVTFYLKGSQILEIADISRISKGKNGNLLGYQRGNVSSHIDEITEYLNSKNVLFPNSIILAMSSEVTFKQSRGPQIGDKCCFPGVLEIPLKNNDRKVAWIVDGQQRTLAMMKSNNKDLMVPITAFLSDDFEVHRTQFLLVNKAKPLPTGLINELLPEVNTQLPAGYSKKQIPSLICNLLNKDSLSPFRGLIIRHSTDKKINKDAVIQDSSLMQVVKNSLYQPQGCLYPYQNFATKEVDVESIRTILNLYWGVVKELFPDAWGLPPTKSRLMHGVGIKAMGILMDRIMNDILPDQKDAPKIIKERLCRIVPYCAWTMGEWSLLGINWNDLQHVRGFDEKTLAPMLIQAYMGVAH